VKLKTSIVINLMKSNCYQYGLIFINLLLCHGKILQVLNLQISYSVLFDEHVLSQLELTLKEGWICL